MSASTNVTATFNAIPQIVTHFVGGTVTGLTGTVVLQNNGTDSISIASDGAFTFPNPLDAGTAYHVTALNQPATQTCSIANGAATVGSTNITNVVVTCSTNLTTLSVSTGTLVLASSGTSRRVTVTNTGMNPAANIAALSMGLPTGTSMTSTCSGTLASGGSCTVTITPGSSASSDCAMGIAPIPDTVTIAGSNSSTVASNVVVLTYGCQYQGGFVYSIDDTTASTGSIGGKVVSLVDQAAPNIASGPQTTSIIWSSNGAGSTPMDVSYDVIPGIAETPGAGDSYVQAQLSFDTEYSNTMTYPFPAASGFQACDGPVDGACNSRNIQALYDSYQTNFGIGSAPYTLSPGPTSRTNYAAGLCTATINGYSDWYLPAVCEVDAHNGNVTCPAGAQSISGNLAFLLGDDAAAVPYTSCSPPDGTSCLAGLYWTSTANSMSPKQHAWTALLSLAGSSQMYVVDKVQTLGVRCSRAFTD
ncbi:hypothetical protein [Povalibacter sp.]|uniref:hypothetical protein n=1 Tax=Povalibacter sp. TaxID=1962978 RepID=UPI002F41C106